MAMIAQYTMAMKAGRGFGLLILAISTIATIYFIKKAKSVDYSKKIREFPAMKGIEEAVGRATEMGRPVHFCPGDMAKLYDALATQTIAALSILRYTSRLCARYGAKLIASCGGSQASGTDILPVVLEIISYAYAEEGKPEAYKPEMVRFISPDQQGLVAGILGLYSRDKPAANLIIGPWGGAIPQVLGGAQRADMITITGTGRIGHLPEMAVMSDYVMIADEMMAAGAAISKEPRILSALMAEETDKYIALALVIIGTILTYLGSTVVQVMLSL